jgi:hypothetical protein
MADDSKKTGTDENVLVSAAKTIGAAAGKIAALAGAGTSPAVKAKENLFQADYFGSGTFVIHKPKRRTHKLRQSRLKGPRRGARK